MPDEEVRHRFYEELAVWWPLVSPPEDYREGEEQFPVHEGPRFFFFLKNVW